MQITIGGEERFYSSKQAYMKAKNLTDLNTEGVSLRLAVSKLSTLSIKRISVTELDEKSPIIREGLEETKPLPVEDKKSKPTFESIISKLPQEFQEKLIEMSGYITSLRPLKFKRTVDKGGNRITYVCSDYGISYSVETFGSHFNHYLNWYIVHNGKPETWHRKADYMEELLVEIAKTNPQLSERIFYALIDCLGCFGSGCLAKTLYTYNGQKRLTCHGRVLLRMCDSDLLDAKEFFHHLNVLIERKIGNGEPSPEKILLIQSRKELVP